MKLYSVCHKEFRSKSVELLTPDERQHVISYIVNEHYLKDWSRFSDLVGNIKEYELEKYNPKYQLHNYFEYGTIAHIYLNSSLRDTHVGILHSDIVFEQNSVSDMLEEFDRTPDTIFYNTFFGAAVDKLTQHPLYLTPAEVHILSGYLADRIGIPINAGKVLNHGWIGGMAAGPVEVFMRFGEFMERYTDELQRILDSDILRLQSYPGKHTICGIIERLWGFYLVSLDLPIKYMRIIHDGNNYQHDHR